jgi:hypothetical protein
MKTIRNIMLSVALIFAYYAGCSDDAKVIGWSFCCICLCGGLAWFFHQQIKEGY